MWSKIILMVNHHRIFRNFRTGLPVVAPLLWALLVVLFWLPKLSSTLPEPDPKELPTRRHCCALKQHHRKITQRANVPQVGSIRSHRLHRKYPINLRSMGHYIRRDAPTLVEHEQQVQLNAFHSKVATLVQRVELLKRPIPPSTTGPAATATTQSRTWANSILPHAPRHISLSIGFDDARGKNKGQSLQYQRRLPRRSSPPTAMPHLWTSQVKRRLSPCRSYWLSRPREPSVDLQATSGSW